MSNVGSSILRDRHSVAELMGEVVEVEFGFLEAEVSEGSGGHEVAFHVAGAFPFAHNDVFLAFERFLEPLLLILLIRIERFAQFYSLVVAVGGLSEEASFAVAGVGDVELVVVDDGDEGAGADVSRPREALLKGHLGHLVPILLDPVECFVYSIDDFGLLFGVLELFVEVGVEVAHGVLRDLPPSVSIEHPHVEPFEVLELVHVETILAGIVSRVLQNKHSIAQDISLRIWGLTFTVGSGFILVVPGA